MYSFSGLSTTDTNSKYGCWHKFYCRYILQLPSLPGLPLIFGKACHAVIETAIKAGNAEIMPALCQAVVSASDLEDEKQELKDVYKHLRFLMLLKMVEKSKNILKCLLMTHRCTNTRGYIDFNQRTTGII